jgi:hypothetical protein
MLRRTVEGAGGFEEGRREQRYKQLYLCMNEGTVTGKQLELR